MSRPETSSFIPDGIFVILLNSPIRDLNCQQAGGYACIQKSAIGELLELSQDDEEFLAYFTGPKHNGWCCDGIDNETADWIEVQPQLNRRFKVDRLKLTKSCEAWVFGSYDGNPAILTWSNSD